MAVVFFPWSSRWQKNDKKRFFIENGKICATHGHIVNVMPPMKETEQPDILFHGTSKSFLESIMDTGLDKRDRLFVHMTTDITTAADVGKRHDGELVILRINAKSMKRAGFIFYVSLHDVWLTDHVPPQYMCVQE